MPEIVTVGGSIPSLPRRVESRGQSRRRDRACPADVAMACARLGTSAAFLGRVGCDAQGKAGKRLLAGCGVDVTGLFEIPCIATGQGDAMPTCTEVVQALHMLQGQPQLLYFDTDCFASESARDNLLSAARYAKNQGITTVCSYRAAGEPEAVRRNLLASCGVLLITREDLRFITGTMDPDEGTLQITSASRVPAVVVLSADRGLFYRVSAQIGGVGLPADMQEDCTETAFLGALLTQIALRLRASNGVFHPQTVGTDLRLAVDQMAQEWERNQYHAYQEIG